MALPTVHEMAASIFAFTCEQYLNSASTYQIKQALKKTIELISVLRKEDEEIKITTEPKQPIVGVPKETVGFKEGANRVPKEEIKKEILSKTDLVIPKVPIKPTEVKSAKEVKVAQEVKSAKGIKDAGEVKDVKGIEDALEVKKRKPRSDKGVERKKKPSPNKP